MAASRTLTGRTAAITGGARGIGAAIAAALAAEGVRVLIGDLDLAAAEATAAALPGAVATRLDVTSTESYTEFLDTAERVFGGGLDVLVNNAGVMWVGPFDEETDAAAQRQVEVNLLGVVRGHRLAAPRMRTRGSGHLVTIASAGSRLPPPGEATYAATKHAVLGYVTAVREELRGTGVDLTLIMPVVVETELAVGTAAGRGRRLAPEDVAKAVVGAVRRPRFEVYVPREVVLATKLAALLPQRARDVLLRALVPDQVRDTDRTSRSGYESRSALGAPAER